ncbi:MAG: hypothetical protein R3C14_26200 [Caldilineaceae bacterium]
MSTLATELADLYPENDDIRRIAYDAGIPDRAVNLDNAPITDWHNLLVEACRRNKLNNLIGVIQNEYPAKASALNQGLVDFQAQNPVCGRLGALTAFVGDHLIQIIGGLLVAVVSTNALDYVTDWGLLSKLAAGLGMMVIILTPFLLGEYLPMVNLRLRRRSLWGVAALVILCEAALFSSMTGAHLTNLYEQLPAPERKYRNIFTEENKYLHDSSFIEVKVLPDKPQQINVIRDTDASPGPLHVFVTVEISKTLAMPPFPRNYTGQFIYAIHYTCTEDGNPEIDIPKLKAHWLKPGSMTLSWLIGFMEIPFLMDDDTTIASKIGQVIGNAVQGGHLELCPSGQADLIVPQ